MKNIWLYRGISPAVHEMLTKMKLTIFILCVSVLGSFATGSYAQTTRLTLDVENATIKTILTKIESQSEFKFFYSSNVDVGQTASISQKNKKVFDILDELFEGTGIKYEVYGRQIALMKQSETFTFAPEETLAQQKSVSGTVTDDTGQPLPGVTVVIKGTTQGTVTNVDGEYILPSIPENATLQFSFVGMRTQEITVGNQTRIDVRMVVDAIGIEEVVAVGYGTRKVADITGSISTVNSEQIQDITAVNVADVLKGTVAGITATRRMTPGEDAIIRIRGLGTINNNDPLWVVDGAPGGAVNPNNIETITILKDASAQAIYGARAANGVILVTTKSGSKNQEIQINVKVKNGFSHNVTSYSQLSTQEYGEMLWLSAKNEGITNYSHPTFGSGSVPDIPEYLFPARATNVDHSLYDDLMIHEDGTDTYFITKTNKDGTDWLKEISRLAHYQEYSLDITGGGEKSNYSLMANYLDEEGILKWTNFNRINLMPNLSFEPTKWLKIGENVGITYSEDWGNQTNNRRTGPIGSSYRMLPFIPVHDIAGNYAGSIVPGGGNVSNPMSQLDFNQHDVRKRLEVGGNVFVEIIPIEELRFKSLFGFNYNTLDGRDINYVEKAFAERGRYDQLTESASFGTQWSWTNTVEYTKKLGEIHNFTMLAGTEAVKSNYVSKSGSISEFFSRNPDYITLSSGVSSISVAQNLSDWSLFSYFARLNYDLYDKYLLALTVRRDGSSRFGKENRFGNFPAISLGWRISEESFLESTSNWLSYLKLRVGWGQSGNDQIGNYNSFTTFSSRNGGTYDNSYYPITGINEGTPTPGFQSATFGNPNVKWETTTTTNLGFDIMLFNTIDIVLDLWQRSTTDMLFPKQIPHVQGTATAPSINIGEMNNTGFDLNFGYSGNAFGKELSYNISLNISHYKNEIIKLSDVETEFISGGIDYAVVGRAEIGTAFPEIYGYVMEGIFQTEEEAANHPPAFGKTGTYNAPGHIKYKDVNKDGVINTDDRTYIGNPHPDFTAGLLLRLQYKRLELSGRFYTSYGNDIYNATRTHRDYNRDTAQRSRERLYKSWGSPYLDNNANATLAKAEFNDAGSYEHSSQFIEDGSYLRLENLRIGYKLEKLFKNVKIRNLEIYGQVNNLFTITNYSGLDPEIAGTGLNLGIDYGSWPQSRQYLFGINIGL